MTVATQALVHDLVRARPELRLLLDEHLEDNDGELLPHVFFGDVTRWLVGNAGDKPEAVRVVLDLLESAWSAQEESVHEVIALSFLDDLGPDEAAALQLGPRLEAAAARWWGL